MQHRASHMTRIFTSLGHPGGAAFRGNFSSHRGLVPGPAAAPTPLSVCLFALWFRLVVFARPTRICVISSSGSDFHQKFVLFPGLVPLLPTSTAATLSVYEYTVPAPATGTVLCTLSEYCTRTSDTL